VALVELAPSDAVAQEWHLIILSPTYTAMVLCQELSPEDYGAAGVPASDLERKFYGLWTFEPELVQETVDLAISHIGAYNSELHKKLVACRQGIQPSIGLPQDLGEVVSRVVDYLQVEQHDLSAGKDLNIPTPSRQQALDRNLVSNEIQAFLRMAQLMDMADVTNPMAAAEVVGLSEMMGQLLDLPAWQMKRLRLAALLHRLDSIQRVEPVLCASVSFHYQEDAPSCPLTCPLVPGAQVLRTMPQLRAVAQIVAHQTEWWNGTGDPAGLGGDDIPLESRILALAAEFQWRVSQKNKSHIGREESFAEALAECRQQQGTRFDPKLIETLSLLVMGMQQGLSLPITPTKVTAGMWLLDANLYSGTAARSASVAN
jgi:HD-GYP domain-containing protein (c-di-GMP phosphodiesterase class II)